MRGYAHNRVPPQLLDMTGQPAGETGVAYHALSEEAFPRRWRIIPALEVYAAEAGGTWRFTVIEENGEAGLQVQTAGTAVPRLGR
jgi:hypothetical protein